MLQETKFYRGGKVKHQDFIIFEKHRNNGGGGGLLTAIHVNLNPVLFEDEDKIRLISKFAYFNTRTFETTFINEVKVSRKDEIITADKLYLVLEDKKNLSKKDSNLGDFSNAPSNFLNWVRKFEGPNAFTAQVTEPFSFS